MIRESFLLKQSERQIKLFRGRMKMKTDNVPALVMLSAGALYCLIGIRNGIEFTQFMTQLLMVLIIFLIIGSILRAVLDKSMDVIGIKL